jgi:competence protein ComEA
MQLFETEPGRPARTARRSTGNTSPASRGEGRKRALAASRSLGARAEALRHGIWGPVLAKGAAILFGMLALAAIGAASLSRGAGVPLGAASVRRDAAGLALPASSYRGTHPVGMLAAGLVPLAPNGPHVSPSAETLDDAGPDGGAPTGPGAGSPGLTADGKVILNRADASELRRLPGVGAKRAEAILALRAKLGGRFKRVSDLLRVKGIGPKGLKKIEPHVVLDEPKQS